MKTLYASAAVLLLAGCLDMGSATANMKVSQMPENTVATDPSVNPDNPTVFVGGCDVGKSYVGFGGTRLEVGRDEEEVGFDRDRVKPLSALSGEYARVLGTTPALLNQLTSSFGSTPARWYVEPEATAVSLFSAMRVAFVGCLETTNSAAYDDLPTEAIAQEKCSEFATRFWSRSPDTEELQSCVQVATMNTSAEPQPRRKWAYVCASVLSAAPFLTY
jgi:hypothetical protein